MSTGASTESTRATGRSDAAPATASPRSRDRMALPGAGLAAVGFVATGDPVGLAAGALILLAWAVTPPVALATFGAFLFVAVQPGGPLGILAGAGLAAILLGPMVRFAEPVAVLLATSAIAVVLCAVVAWTAATVSLTAAAGALAVAAALVGYGVHRYEVVTVERAPTAEEVTTDG